MMPKVSRGHQSGSRFDELWDEKQWQEEAGRAKERVQAMHRRKKELQARHWETWAAVKQAVDSRQSGSGTELFSQSPPPPLRWHGAAGRRDSKVR